MRIAVATNDQKSVSAHPGRCAGFAIFEVGDSSATRVEYRPNDVTAHGRGECTGQAGDHHAGQHSHTALIRALADCQAFVTAGMGPRLIADLLSSGVQPYICQPCTLEDAADRFAQGELQPASRDSGCTQGR